jgi:hypothetical protein
MFIIRGEIIGELFIPLTVASHDRTLAVYTVQRVNLQPCVYCTARHKEFVVAYFKAGNLGYMATKCMKVLNYESKILSSRKSSLVPMPF